MGLSPRDMYEADRAAERTNKAQDLAERTHQLRLDLKSFGVPDRFTDSLEDLFNYITTNWPK